MTADCVNLNRAVGIASTRKYGGWIRIAKSRTIDVTTQRFAHEARDAVTSIGIASQLTLPGRLTQRTGTMTVAGKTITIVQSQ